MAALELGSRSGSGGLVHRELTAGLHLTLVVDEPEVMVDVTDPMLASWGRTMDEALDRAEANLLARSDEPFVALGPGDWLGPWDDAYAASRATLPSPMDRLTTEPVVAVPDRDTLLVADGRSVEAVAALVACVCDLIGGSPFPIAPVPFRCGDGRWSPLALPASHPVAPQLDKLNVEARLRGYDHQQGPLQRHLGDERYVASAEACQSLDGRQELRALWTQGVDTWLPEVDHVHLLQDTGEAGISSRFWVVSWDVLRELPDALERTSLHMPRWRTREFPAVDQLRRIAVPAERDPHTAALQG
ncbi:MAG: hypothetical protein JRI68_02455 [Deltaproteobacteria bacterium]|nr:hypothetical protein [Deltaproteobacteria bacterium]